MRLPADLRGDLDVLKALLEGDDLSPFLQPAISTTTSQPSFPPTVALLTPDAAAHARDTRHWPELPVNHPRVRDAYIGRLAREVTLGTATPHYAALGAGLRSALGDAGLACLSAFCGLSATDIAGVVSGGLLSPSSLDAAAGGPGVPLSLRSVFRVVWDEELQVGEDRVFARYTWGGEIIARNRWCSG
jgi:hypothetical protein